MDELVVQSEISSRILTLRGKQVMLDRDLAELYKVDTKRLNEQVKRNIDRFPDDFMFQLTDSELENWKSQYATSNKEIMGLRKMPYAFDKLRHRTSTSLVTEFYQSTATNEKYIVKQ